MKQVRMLWRRTISRPSQNLWSKVLRCTAERVRCPVLRHVELTEAEVAQRYVTVVVEQDVLGLEITVGGI